MITHSPLAWEHVQVRGCAGTPVVDYGTGQLCCGDGQVPASDRGWPSRTSSCQLEGAGPRRCAPLTLPLPHLPLAQFKDVAVKVKSAETLYKGITFYLEEHPDLLNDLLKVGGHGWGPLCAVAP